MINKLFLLLTLLLLTVTAGAQVRSISSSDYWTAIRNSSGSGDAKTTREIESSQFWEEGKLTETHNITIETIVPDHIHYLRESTTLKAKTSLEMFRVGEQYYCKQNKAAWKKSNESCLGESMSGFAADSDTDFTLEDATLNGKAVKLYVLRVTEKYRDGVINVTYKTWIGEDGRRTRSETERLNQPERTRFVRSTSYEYDPANIKIEAPIR